MSSALLEINVLNNLGMHVPKRLHIYVAYGGFGSIILLSALSFFWQAPVDLLASVIEENMVLGAVSFVVAMFIATVIAPVAVLPAVPFVAPILGPFLTGVLSIIGWTLGAVVAFLIARHAGKPVLEKFVSLKDIERYESYIPNNLRFLGICALRMMLPVDVLSYALGFVSKISLLEYTFATAVGVSWFSFAFAYLGDAAFEKNLSLFVIVGTVSIIILGLSWYYVIQQVRKRD